MIPTSVPSGMVAHNGYSLATDSLLTRNGLTAAPTYEEVLRSQAEEEEEEAREEEIRQALADEQDALQQQQEEEDEEHDQSQSSTPHSRTDSAPSNFIPTGWLTLENATESGESKKRWCVLQRCFLFYAGRDKDLLHPKGVVDLKGCDVQLARIEGANGGGDGGGMTLPSAFVLSHPKRASLTFTCANDTEREGWMRALTAAIRAPTHALLSYKGRAIFDAEDAQAISSSQAAIRGFVQSQMERVTSQKQEEAARLQRRKEEIKSLKAQKKALAKELVAASAAYEKANAASEELSQELDRVQRDSKAYEEAQKQFLLSCVDLLNQMEDSDPNRWNGPLISHTFSDGLNMSPTSSQPPSANSSARRANQPTSEVVEEDQELLDGVFGTPINLPPVNITVQVTPPRTKSHPNATLSSSTFSTPMNQRHISSSAVPTPQSTTSSATFSPATMKAVTEAMSCIDISTEQLQFVQQQLDLLKSTPIPTIDDQGSPTLASSPTATSSTLDRSSSFSMDGVYLTRPDAYDLSELQHVSLDLLQTNLALRKESNILTKYIEQWMKRKHAIRVLKATVS